MTAEQLIALLAHIADLAAENASLRKQVADAQEQAKAALEKR